MSLAIMTNWKMLFGDMEEENSEWGFEELVREMIRQQTGFDCEKKAGARAVRESLRG
jgi:hypothetical protein